MKLNNKGFTLVEVIAVIALICILSGLVATAVSPVIMDSKRKTYTNYEKNLETAATNYMTAHSELLSVAEGFTLDANSLINGGFLESMVDPVDEELSCNGSSYVYVDRKQANGSYNLNFTYKVCLKCSDYQSDSCP